MRNLFCEICGQSTLPNMLICPQCGGRKFSSIAPVSPKSVEPAPIQSSNQTTGIANSDPNIPTLNGNTAKHMPRFIAAIIDIVLSQGAMYIAAIILFLVGSPQKPEAIFALYFILGMTIQTLYYSLQHASTSQATVGKRLMGLKLVTLTGGRVSLGLAVLRILLLSIVFIFGTAIFAIMATPMVLLAEGAPELQISAISVFLLIYVVFVFVPFLMVFGNAAHKTLFDIICKTRVIEA